MLARGLLVSCIRSCRNIQIARMSVVPSKIGNREVVGYGPNSQPDYIDHMMYPMPPVRFRETTSDIQALREKEKGDWKKLTIEEKKALYRASFCQTFEEMDAPSGEWKSVVGVSLMIVTTALWMVVIIINFVFPPVEEIFTLEFRQGQLEKMRALDINPITGIGRRQ